MKEGKQLIVTIGRQYGSGGSEIGSRLARELGIHFYDKNILRMNSDQSGIKESYYYLADEKAGNKLLYKIVKSLTRKREVLPLAPTWCRRTICSGSSPRSYESWRRRRAASSWDDVLIMCWRARKVW